MRFEKLLSITIFLLFLSSLAVQASAADNTSLDGLSLDQDSSDAGLAMSWATYFGGNRTDTYPKLTYDLQANLYLVAQTNSLNYPTLNAYQEDRGHTSIVNADVGISSFFPNGTLRWSTYLGGGNDDYAVGMRVGSDNNLYLVGYTSSHDFPTANASYSKYKGSGDLFAASFTSDGKPRWSCIIGGSGSEEAVDFGLDGNNTLYIIGETQSTNFPTRSAYQQDNAGRSDILVTAITSNGTYLWGTYLGGEESDMAGGIKVSQNGSVYLYGNSYSYYYPVKNAYQDRSAGQSDIVLSLFSSNGTLQSSTYFGGRGRDQVNDAVFQNNTLYITGETDSDLPLINSWQASKETGTDAFIAVFSNNLDLQWGTYLGGNGNDLGLSLVVDSQNNIYLSGLTSSANLPVTNAFQTTYAGETDMMLASFTADGALRWLSYFGGEDAEGFLSGNMAIDGQDNIHITGTTYSNNLPVVKGTQKHDAYLHDAFFSSVTSSGELWYSNYIGGDAIDDGYQVIIHGNQSVLAGTTSSDNFPTRNPYQDNFQGMSDIFLMKFALDSDSDGIPDDYEIQVGLDPYFDDAEGDLDGDGMSNIYEYLHGLDPTVDDAEGDLDGDGMPNIWEYLHGTDASHDDGLLDPDRDGYSNREEYDNGTDPNKFTYGMDNFFKYAVPAAIILSFVLFQYGKKKRHQKRLREHQQRLIEETSVR